MDKLKGKVAIVTGGGRGIGKAIARACASEGADVAIISRTSSDLESVAREINDAGSGRALPIRADVAVERDVKNVVAKVIKRFGRIDILVNNAAIGGVSKPVEEITEAEWDRVMEINVKGPFLLTREALPFMLKHKSGNIINVSSGAGVKRPRKHIRSVPYMVSKFAVEGLSHAIATRLRGSGINVNVLRPGFTRTSLQASWTPEELKRLKEEVGEFLEPESVNGLALFLASLEPGEITDQEFNTVDWIKERGSKGTFAGSSRHN
jgi:NAD(P)-dependent dehydrogenase (short-subunit alcohol dehydrogenase family)